MVGYVPYSLCVNHKEGLYPSSEDINRLMSDGLSKQRECKVWNDVRINGGEILQVCLTTPERFELGTVPNDSGAVGLSPD
jgi:hypothetical protein